MGTASEYTLKRVLDELEGLTLPTGAATETTLAAILAKLADPATQTTLAALLTELQAKADLTETQPVSAASLPLPAGAATEATLSSILTELESKLETADLQYDGSGYVYVTDPVTQAALARAYSQMDFWGDYHSGEIAITTSSGDKTFDAGCQITPALPSGATIQRAVVMMKFRYVKEDSGSANAIDTTALTPAVQIEKVSGGSWIDAITIVADMLTCAGDGKEGGDIWVGDLDIKAQVASGAASEFQLDDVMSDADSLYIGEVQFGLRIWFT